MKFSHGPVLLLLAASGLALVPATAQHTPASPAATAQPQSRIEVRTIVTRQNGKTSVRKQPIRTFLRKVGQTVPGSAHTPVLAPASHSKSITIKVPATAQPSSSPSLASTGSKTVTHPRFGGGGSNINSQALPNATIAGTPTTATLTYESPDSSDTFNVTLFSGVNFSIKSGSCSSDGCSVTISFTPLHPGLLKDAVSITDANGTILYQTFVYGTGIGPQFGYDFGNESIFGTTDPNGNSLKPAGITVGPDGNYYYTDQLHNQVIKLTRDPQIPYQLTANTTLGFTNLGTPAGIAVDGTGTVFVADQTNNVVTYLTTAGVQANVTITGNPLSNPQGLAVDGAGSLYICDTGNDRILKIDIQGNQTIPDPDIDSPQAIAIDAAGDLFITDAGAGGEITELNSDGGSQQVAGQLGQVQGIAVDPSGRLYYTAFAGFGSYDPAFGYTTFGGNSNQNDGPYAVAVDNNGDVLTTQPADGNFTITDRFNSNFILNTPIGSSTSGYIASQNTGNADLTFTNQEIPAPFTIDPASVCTSATVLAASQSCSTIIDFTPTNDTSYNENYVVTSNSLNAPGSIDNFNVSGQGQGFPTSTTLSIPEQAALINTPVTFTATVNNTSDSNGLPTGMIQFNDNGNYLASVQIPQGSTTVSYTTSTLASGGHAIQAIYEGDSLFLTSQSEVMDIEIDPTVIQTATSLEVSAATITAGQPETLTALIAAEYTQPTGTVTFSDQNGVLGTVAVTGSGQSGSQAVLTLTTLTAGAHSIIATYSGDSTFTSSTSTPMTVTVNPAGSSTATTLTITPATTTYQTPVTFQVNTAASSGQAILCDTSAPQCSLLFNLAILQINSDGNASVKLPAGVIGSHTFVATFLGIAAGDETPPISASTSAPATVTVTGKFPSATAITSTGTQNPYTLTGTVVGTGSRTLAPTGAVTFNDTTNTSTPLLGTANLGAATLGFTAAQPTGSPLTVGAEPYGVATGDFNGDGFMDLVTENYGDGTISVLLGNGDGTFQAAVSYPVGSEPERVLVADFNADGYPDLVVANTGSGTVSILINTGNGTFQPQVTYQAGSPVGLGVLDLNHDGFPDIAIGDYYDGTMTVLLNTGDGTFQTAVTYPTSSTPQTLAEGDFNGDGNIDIVIGNEGSASVGIFLGNGDGTFQAQVTYAVGNGPQGVQTADFNGDGKLDLAVVNSGDNTLSILLGNGDGTFQTQVTYPSGDDPVGLVIADFNGDGKQDIALGNTAQDDLTESILFGNGDGTFQPQIKIPAANFPYGEAVADFNGDGYPDLAISAFKNGQATILLSQVTQTATATLNATISGSGTHNLDAVYAGDTNYSGSASAIFPLVITSTATISPGTSTTIANGGLAPGSANDYTFFGNRNVEFGDPGGGQPTKLTDFTVNTLQNVEYPGNGNYTTITAPGGTAPFTTGTLTENPTNYPNTTPHTTLLATFSPLAAGPFTVYILDGNTDGVYVGNSSVGIGVNGGTEVATASRILSGGNEFTAYTVTGASPSDVFQVYATTSTNAYPTIGALTFNIATAPTAQTITFPAIPNHTVGDAPFYLAATASSGLAVTYTVTSGPATISGNTVTLTGTAGTVTIQASQAGNSQYAAATPVSRSFTVAPSTALTLTSLTPNSGAIGSPATTITLTGTNFSTSDIVQLNGATLTSVYVSSTSLTAVIPAAFFNKAAVGQVTVHDAETSVTSAALPFTVSTAPEIVFTGPSSATSGTQPKLTFTLVNPYPVALAGTLTLTFAPATETGINDPSVQFATGGRTLAFNIPANSTTTPTVQLQTGTVAGTATIALAVTANGVSVTPADVAPVVITIPPTVPSITSTSIKREANTLTLSIVGFSNTREALKATFHFTPVAGGNITDPDATLDVTSSFIAWYTTAASDAYGSAFTYTQVFTLDQDAAVVDSVKVTLANTIGSSTPATTQ